MQLYKKQKTHSEVVFFLHFWNLDQNLNILKIEMTLMYVKIYLLVCSVFIIQKVYHVMKMTPVTVKQFTLVNLNGL